MKYVKTAILSMVSVVALSQPAIANESAQLTNDAKVALNSMLTNNIANLESTSSVESIVKSFAELEIQLQTNQLVEDAMKLLPQTPNYKVVIAD